MEKLSFSRWWKKETSIFYFLIHTHSTKLSSPKGWDASTGLRPVISSSSTTPNENTSDLSVNFPLDAYSGAKYLRAKLNIHKRMISRKDL